MLANSSWFMEEHSESFSGHFHPAGSLNAWDNAVVWNCFHFTTSQYFIDQQLKKGRDESREGEPDGESRHEDSWRTGGGHII